MPRPRHARPALMPRQIAAARPGPRDLFLWDGLEHGLGVKITPTGSKIFVVQKPLNRKLTRFTLGHTHDMTLDQARREARRIAALVEVGRDPRKEGRTARRTARTMDELWARYFAEVVAVGNKPRTAAEKERMWVKHIRPVIGELPVAEVTDEDVAAIIRRPMRFDEDGRILRGKGQAGNLYRLLKHLFSRARAWGIRPHDLPSPMEGIAQPKVPRRERLLSDEEVGALQQTLEAYRTHYAERPEIVGAIRATLLTGARISEMLNLEWKHVRRTEMALHLPDTKVGFSRRPISRETLAVFDEMRAERPGRYVFRSQDADRPLPYYAVQKAFKRIAVAAGVEDCSLHTLRHWFATKTANTTSNPRLGMALTGHKSHAAYLNYVHSNKADAEALANAIAAQVVALGGGAPKEERP